MNSIKKKKSIYANIDLNMNITTVPYVSFWIKLRLKEPRNFEATVLNTVKQYME